MVTAEEVIGIQKERASRMGEINFATNFRDTRQTYAEIGASCTHSEGRDGVLVFAEDQERLEKAMIDTHKAFERLKKNGSRLKKHPGAVKQATAIVDQQLRNIGKKDRWIETRDLRAKVKEVVTHHVKLPPPTHVTVLVQIPQRLNRSIEFELKEANLPLDSTFAEGADLLQELLLSELLMRCDTMDIYPSSIETKTVDWDYQLVRGLNNRALWQEKLCLRSTKDWKRMMGSIAQTDQTSTDLPMAVLSCRGLELLAEQGRFPSIVAENEALDQDECVFSEPWEWSKMQNRYAGGIPLDEDKHFEESMETSYC